MLRALAATALAIAFTGCATLGPSLPTAPEGATTLSVEYNDDLQFVVQGLQSDGCREVEASEIDAEVRMRCPASGSDEMVVALDASDGRTQARGTVWTQSARGWAPVTLSDPETMESRALLSSVMVREQAVSSVRFVSVPVAH